MKHKRLCWIFVALLSATTAIPIASTFRAAAGISIPLYDVPTGELAALVRIEDFRHDHRRIGFFKMGFMPLVVLSNVSVRIHNPKSFAKNVTDFAKKLKTEPEGLPIEIRNFELINLGTEKPLLKARLAKARPDQTWDLADVVFCPADGEQLFSRVQLKFFSDGPEILFGNSKTVKVFPPNP